MPNLAQSTDVHSDATLRWSAHRGAPVAWLQSQSPFESKTALASLLDIWEMPDGDSVLITNRLADLSLWFQLHPSEARDSLMVRVIRIVKRTRIMLSLRRWTISVIRNEMQGKVGH